MAAAFNKYFDFSLDAQQFKLRLAKELQQAQASEIVALDDDDLEYVNAAGVPRLPPKDEQQF